MAELADLFRQRLESVAGAARWCAPTEAVDIALDAARSVSNPSVVYTDSVAALLPTLIPALREAGLRALPARSLQDALDSPIALSTAELAIAETGTVVALQAQLTQRAPALLSLVHLIFLPADHLVATLDDAAVWLHEHATHTPYISFITGPSRTSDIERTLTIGVQGPRTLTVVFVA